MRSSSESSLPASVMLHIDEICDTFEKDRRGGKDLPVSHYLEGVPEEYHTALNEELELVVQDLARMDAQETVLSSIHSLGDRTTSSRPEFVGPFHLIEQVGQGSFGDVWKAMDLRLNRTVALKIAHSVQGDLRQGFLREAKASARLQHPGIVRILEVGQWDDQLCIVRQYVEGESLADRLREGPMKIRDSVQIAIKLAEALAYSHQMQCIHRDLKPQNILLSEDGCTMIMDFGLAKHESSEGTMAKTGMVLGTPAYMSPEQARGEGHRVDGRADIWSLGVILYQMTTGQPPYQGRFETILSQVIQDPPPPPRRLRREISADLATIILKCLEKEPARRYDTAQDLANDLQRYLDGRPIAARPVSVLIRAWRWCRRYPVITGLCSAIAVLLTCLAIGSTLAASYLAERWKYEKDFRLLAETEAKRARTEQATADEISRFMENVFVASDPLSIERLEGRIDRDSKAVEFLDRAAERIHTVLEGQPRVQARLMDTIANVYRSIGDFASAEELLVAADQVRKQIQATPNDVLWTLEQATHDFYRGCLCQSTGDLVQARHLLEHVLQIRARELGSESLPVADVWFQLGWTYLDEHKAEAAREPFLKALAIRSQRLAPNHPDVVLAKLAEAQTRIQTGETFSQSMLLAEALSSSKLGQLVRQGLQIQGARLTGNYPLAIETYRQLLGDLETAFGKGDPKLLLAQGDFAGLLWEAGYYGEAFELIEPVLETGRRIAPRHPRLHDALGHLASELVQAGRYSEAERHLRDALAMKTEPLERDLELWQGLAIVLLETDRVPEAQEVLDRARQLRIEDPALSAWFTYLDSLACRARDPTRSRDLMDQAYRAIEGLSPVSLGTVGLTRAATIFAELEQWEKALEFRQQALRLEERKRPAQHPKIADQLHALGHLRMKLNQWDQARQDLVLALEIRRNRLPEADRRIQDSQSLLQQIP